MSGWALFYTYLDAALMPLFRFPETPILGFYLGTLVLALVCVVLGDFTYNLVVRADRKKIGENTAETIRLNNLSIDALQAGDGDSYRACNKLANEAFGRMFFLQVALSTASLWPVPFAMAWLQYRFFEAVFPLPGVSVTLGYAGVFLPMYVLARILFGQIRSRLPFFRGAREIFQSFFSQSKTMRSWRELFPRPTGKTS